MEGSGLRGPGRPGRSHVVGGSAEKGWQARGGTYWKDGNLYPAQTARCRGGRQESHCVPLPASTGGISTGRVQRGTPIDARGYQGRGDGRSGAVPGATTVYSRREWWAARVCARRGGSGRRTCLSCNSALLRMSASASRVAIMQLLMAEASILTSRRGPVHTEGSVLFASRQEGRGRGGKGASCVDACVVRLLCGLRSAGAVVNNSRLSRRHLTKIWRAEKVQGKGPQRGSGQQKPIAVQIRSVTVTAPSRLSV